MNMGHGNQAAIGIAVTKTILNSILGQGKQGFPCEICDTILETYLLYEKHKASHKIITCNICNLNLSCSANLRRHMRYIHEVDKINYKSCQICRKSFKYISSLDKHMLTHLPTPKPGEEVTCKICGKTYKNNKQLKVHSKYAHLDEKLPCEKCGSVFKNKFVLTHHIKMVHGEKPVKQACPICGRMCRNIKRHISTHSASGNVPCTVCGKIFSNVDNMQAHRRLMHNPEGRKYICEHCGASFKSSALLKSHYTVHSDERKYKCNVCEKTFKFKSAVTEHMNLHNLSAQYVCKKCGKSFKWRGTFNKHSNRCTGGKVPCDICGKILNNTKNMQLHKRLRHNPEGKKYICEICGASLKSPVFLKNHYAVHSDERNYKCELCNKTFKFKAVLNTHMSVHNSSPQFQCKKCGKWFKWRGTFNKHKAKCSGGNSSEDSN